MAQQKVCVIVKWQKRIHGFMWCAFLFSLLGIYFFKTYFIAITTATFVCLCLPDLYIYKLKFLPILLSKMAAAPDKNICEQRFSSFVTDSQLYLGLDLDWVILAHE